MSTGSLLTLRYLGSRLVIKLKGRKVGFAFDLQVDAPLLAVRVRENCHPKHRNFWVFACDHL